MIQQPFLAHNHSDSSNMRLRDAINKVEDILDYSLELGLPGIAITDHEVLSSHVKATRYIEDNKEKFSDFKLGLGNEIYLVDREDMEKKKEDNEKIFFHHFLVLAKNQKGYMFLKELSTRAWENSFFYKGLERTPTYFDDLKELIKGYENDVIFSSACLGSPLSQLILQYHEDKSKQTKKKIHEFIKYLVDMVGKDNFYLELQPAIKHDKSNIENKQEQQKIGRASCRERV